MIIDIIDVFKFEYFLDKKKPYLITFYEEDINKNNFNLYSFLKSLEKEFRELPIVRFDYKKFNSFFPNENVTSANHLLLIEGYGNRTLYDTTDHKTILSILIKMKNLIFNPKMKNMDLTKIKHFNKKPWIINSPHYKNRDINKLLEIPVKIQYKFPNCTAGDSNQQSFNLINKTKRLLSSPKHSKNTKIIYKRKLKLTDTNSNLGKKSNISKSYFPNFLQIYQIPHINSDIHSNLPHIQYSVNPTTKIYKSKIKNSANIKNFPKLKEPFSRDIFQHNPCYQISDQQTIVEPQVTAFKNTSIASNTYQTLLLPDLESKFSSNYTQRNITFPQFIHVPNLSYYPSNHYQPNVSIGITEINKSIFSDINNPKTVDYTDCQNFNQICDIRDCEPTNESSPKLPDLSCNQKNMFFSIGEKFVSDVEREIYKDNNF